jgi:multiple sugar transport system permease protein
MSYLSSLPRRTVTLYIPLAVFVVVLQFPFYWMAVDLVQGPTTSCCRANGNPFWIVAPTPGALQQAAVPHLLPGVAVDTMIVSVVATFVSLLASVFAAYAIERLRFRGSGRPACRSSWPTWYRPRSCSSRWPRSCSSWGCSTPAGR